MSNLCTSCQFCINSCSGHIQVLLTLLAARGYLHSPIDIFMLHYTLQFKAEKKEKEKENHSKIFHESHLIHTTLTGLNYLTQQYLFLPHKV